MITTIVVPVTARKLEEIEMAIREHNGIPAMNEELAMNGYRNISTQNLWSNVQVAFVLTELSDDTIYDACEEGTDDIWDDREAYILAVLKVLHLNPDDSYDGYLKDQGL